jgi:ketosteroid isomerase-like protein
MTTHENVDAVLSRWTAAEVGGGTAALQQLIAEEFTGVGPLGFTLSKQDWLDRHAPGALAYTSFELTEMQVHDYGDTATVIGRQHADGTYQGHPTPSDMRITLVLRRAQDEWQIAVAHMSFIAGTPGAPPVPGRG